MVHPQLNTLLITNNFTDKGIFKVYIKLKQYIVVGMHYFYISDQTEQEDYDVTWSPGQENLSNYVTKHHPESHNFRVHLFCAIQYS